MLLARRNRKINGPASKSSKDVAVKEEPTDRSYVEPLPITNISSAASQENGKRDSCNDTRLVSIEYREKEKSARFADFYLCTKIHRRDKSQHKEIHVALFYPIESINNRTVQGGYRCPLIDSTSD